MQLQKLVNMFGGDLTRRYGQKVHKLTLHGGSVALINSASYNENTKYFIAGSFRDGTRVADINPYLWSDLFLANRENVLQELAAFSQQLERWREALTAADAQALQEMMREAAIKRKDLY